MSTHCTTTCDRCGVEMDRYAAGHASVNVNFQRAHADGGSLYESYDHCSACVESYRDWLAAAQDG